MYKTDNDIMQRLREHLNYALNTYDSDWFVLCLQGSQNYGMSDDNSDIDSKLLLIPSLEDLVRNRKPISHTLIMQDETEEHIDCKDIRLYFQTFRKSNLNFVEILFTDYYLVNPKYIDLWLDLRKNAEALAHMNPNAALFCMKGMALEKYHALEHRYPSRIQYIDKFGLDPKQLSHMFRLYMFIIMYTRGASYKSCMQLSPRVREFCIQLKRNCADMSKETALIFANNLKNDLLEYTENILNKSSAKLDTDLDEFLHLIVEKIMRRSLKNLL